MRPYITENHYRLQKKYLIDEAQRCSDSLSLHVLSIIKLFIFIAHSKTEAHAKVANILNKDSPIVRSNIYLLIYVTGDDDVISRGNYVMMSKRPPSWIHPLGFQNFFQNDRKPPQITGKCSETIKRFQKDLNR